MELLTFYLFHLGNHPTIVTDPLGPVPNVNASLATPAATLVRIDPAASANDIGAGPVAVVHVTLVVHNADQAVDVPSLDEAAVVPLPDGGGGDDLHGEEMAPAPSDHGDHGGFSDPPTGVLSLSQQATLEPTIVTRQEPTPNL